MNVKILRQYSIIKYLLCVFILIAWIKTANYARAGEIDLPIMPDGLYLDGNAIPFLLIENGQWIDPYRWIEKHGIQTLNSKYVLNKRFERININAILGSYEEIQFYSLNTSEILKTSIISNPLNFNLKKLKPRITRELCENEGFNLWKCKEEGKLFRTPSFSMKCSTGKYIVYCPGDGGVDKAMYVSETVSTILLKDKIDNVLLKLDVDSLRNLVIDAYTSTSNKISRTGFVKSFNNVHQIFKGAMKEHLASGSIQLQYKSNPNWERRDKYQVEKFTIVNLIYIWDINKNKFLFLQKKPRILSSEAQQKCDKGFQNYCPNTTIMGMWEFNAKLYVVMQHSQRVAIWLHARNSKSKYHFDEGRPIGSAQYEIFEMIQDKTKSIFSTDEFISIY